MIIDLAEIDVMASQDPRLSFQEVLELVKLPPAASDSTGQQWMSTRAAFVPGADLPKLLPRPHKAAYGGHVYGQAALAVSKTLKKLDDRKGTKPSERLGFHVSDPPPRLLAGVASD